MTPAYSFPLAMSLKSHPQPGDTVDMACPSPWLATPRAATALGWVLLGACLTSAGLAQPAVAATGSTPTAPGAASAPDAASTASLDRLLQQAQAWQMKGRVDLARSTLQKLLAVRPKDSRALLLLGELELQAGKEAAARDVAARMQRDTPGSLETVELGSLQRLYGPDRDKLAELRQLRRGGRQAEALKAATNVFPDGLPPGSLAAEFAPLLGSTPGGWERMRRLLTQRVKRFDAPRDRVALYGLLAQRDDTRAEALRGYADLARRNVLPAQSLAEAWAQAAAPLKPADELAQRQLIAKALPSAKLPPLPDSAAMVANKTDLLRGMAPPASGGPNASSGDLVGSLRDEADALVATGSLDEARQLLERALSQRPRHAWLRHDLAKLILRQGQTAAAARVMAEGRELAPDQPEMLQASALVELAADRPDTALEHAAAIPESQRSVAQQRLYRRARFEAAMGKAREAGVRGERSQTQRWLDAATNDADQDPDRIIRLAAAHLETGNKERAVAILQALPESRLHPADAKRRNELLAQARGESRRLKWPDGELKLATGWVKSSRSGSDGRSTLHADEVPVRVSWQGKDGGAMFAQLDRLSLDADPLPTAASEAREFGQVAVRRTSLAAPVTQSDSGFALAVGGNLAGHQFDVGLSGIGMGVSNLVGGWEKRFDRGDFAWGLELSRRSETGSLLSWTGAKDPISGDWWGGVTNTSLAVRASRDFAGAWSGSTSLRLGRLEGRHVQSNTALWWRGTMEKALIERPDLQLSWGVIGAFWHYQHNSGFYTWGHGGYYSPQRYLSFALPLEVGGRAPAWRWNVRASISRSWTREDDVPFYPLDASMQAAAGNPMHSGGTGGGFGRSLRAGIEADVGTTGVLGAHIDLERSTDYSPNRFSVYFRTTWGGPRDAGRSPRWVSPISRY